MISAVFLLVVLALLGAMIVSLSTTQQVSSVRDLLGTRAYYAAKAGIDWGAYQLLQGGGSCSTGTMLPVSVQSEFTVQVDCTPSASHDEAGVSVVVYRITATARIGTLGAHDYAERQLQALIATP